MASSFIYDKYVTGKNFVGRKMDCTILSNLLEAGENVYIYMVYLSQERCLLSNSHCST